MGPDDPRGPPSAELAEGLVAAEGRGAAPRMGLEGGAGVEEGLVDPELRRLVLGGHETQCRP